jgi:hypothetical protein
MRDPAPAGLSPITRRSVSRLLLRGAGIAATATVALLAGLLLVSATIRVRRSLAQSTTLALPAGFDPYLYRTSGARADPINLVFRAPTGAAVAAAVTQVLGWRQLAGSPMTFLDRDQQRPTGYQFGADLGGGSRLHMRIERVTAEDGQTYVLAAVHRDDSRACGHVGHAFDEVRDLVANTFAGAGYTVTAFQIGNTASGPHCDGSVTPSDGVVDLIDLGGV